MLFRNALLLLVGTSTTLASQGAGLWRIRDAPAEIRPVAARADLVFASLHDSVLRELADTFAEGGPEAAVHTVHLDVSLLIHRLHREGIAAGRTSDRLRNPVNRTPRWAEDVVTKWARHDAREIDGYASRVAYDVHS